jgi:hypothetical protein
MSRIETPWKPRSANSRSAESRISVRVGRDRSVERLVRGPGARRALGLAVLLGTVLRS